MYFASRQDLLHWFYNLETVQRSTPTIELYFRSVKKYISSKGTIHVCTRELVFVYLSFAVIYFYKK